MVKKIRPTAAKKTSQSRVFEGATAKSVKESAQQIWLAGMGAFSRAQEEGGKVFENLVKEGVSLQRKTQAVAEEKIGEVTSRMSHMAGDVGSKAGQHWDKLETIFEERVAKSLNKLGVPSARDVDALIKRIDALSAQVAALSKGAGKAPAKAAGKTGAKAPRAAAKPAKAAKPARAAKPRAAAPVERAAAKRATRKRGTPAAPAAADAS